jgi:hypothetical protein
MKTSGTVGIHSFSSKHSSYGMSENEKVISVVARWGTYTSMKVSQTIFEDPFFVSMIQEVNGPPQTKGVVPKLTKKAWKGLMSSEE